MNIETFSVTVPLDRTLVLPSEFAGQKIRIMIEEPKQTETARIHPPDSECHLCRIYHTPNAETLAAMKECEDILSGKIPAKRYKSAAELFAALDTADEEDDDV